MLIPPRVTCCHTWPPSGWREANFLPTRDMFYSQWSQGLLSSVEVQELALTMEVPQGRDSRNSSRSWWGGNWLLNDSVITQILLHPHLSISLFGKISAFVLTLAPCSTRRAEVWSDCVIAKMEEKMLWLWENLYDYVPGTTSLPKLCSNPTLHHVQPLLYLKVKKWNHWNETSAARRAQIICSSGQGDYRIWYLSGLV